MKQQNLDKYHIGDKMFDVYFYEAFEEESEALKKYLPDHISAGFSWKTPQELGEHSPAARLLSIRTQSGLHTSWADQVDGILTRSTGYDHLIDYQRQVKREIKMGYLPLYCNRAVAEQAMMLWMALLRKLPVQMQQFHSFGRDGITGQECQEKTLLVVGVGNIGSEIAKIGQGLGMKVWGVDLVEKHDFVEYADFGKVLPEADVIVCAMNLTSENIGYFDYHCLKKTKPGVIFVNIARGEMSPTHDLQRLLEEGQLGGLAMDVYNEESRLAVALRGGKDDPHPEILATLALVKRDNVIFTPHNAFNTLESVQRKARQSVEQVVQFLKRNEFRWPVPGQS